MSSWSFPLTVRKLSTIRFGPWIHTIRMNWYSAPTFSTFEFRVWHANYHWPTSYFGFASALAKLDTNLESSWLWDDSSTTSTFVLSCFLNTSDNFFHRSSGEVLQLSIISFAKTVRIRGDLFLILFSLCFPLPSFSSSTTSFLTLSSSKATCFFITTSLYFNRASCQPWQFRLAPSSSPPIDFQPLESSHQTSYSLVDIAWITMWIQKRRNRTGKNDNQQYANFKTII